MIVAFLDTCVLLHYPPLAQIDWCKVCGDDAVTLMFCLPVIDQLDDKKNDPNLTARATNRLRELDEVEDKEIRPGVRVTTYIGEPRESDYATLRPDSDSRIMHCAKLYADTEGGNVVMVTEDRGMKGRCRGLGLPVVEPPKDQRLPLAKSDDQKEIVRLTKELADIKGKMPDLVLTVSPSWDDVVEFSKPPEPEPLADRMASYRRDTDRNGWHSGDAANYLAACETRFRNNDAITDENARSFPLFFTFANNGKAPAKGVTLTVTFPPVYSGLVYDSWLDGKRQGHEVRFSENKYKGWAALPPHVHHQPDHFGHESRPLNGMLGGGTFRFELGLMPHGFKISFPALYLTFKSWEDIKPFQLRVKVHTLEPATDPETKILVRAQLA